MRHQCAEVDTVETFDGIMEYGIVHIINGCSELVARDGEYKAICCPCLAFGGIGGTEFFVLGSGGSDRNDKIGRRFGGRNVESGAVARLIDGRILEEAEMALLVPPWAGNCHEVGGEFPEHNFYLFVRRSPLTRVREGCSIWALILSAETVSNMLTQSRRIG